MTEQKSDTVQVLEILTETYVKLVQINAAPGDKAYSVSMSRQFIEKLIKQVMVYKFGKPK